MTECPLESSAAVVVDLKEKKKAETALKESEEKYRSLFANMRNGYAYCKIILDEKNKPVDFVYLEVNDAFEKLTGLKKTDVIGKKVTEAIPGTEETHPELFNTYGRVALTGKEEQFEIYFKPLGIWLSISVYSPQRGFFVAIFENITQRKKAEEELRRFSTTVRTSLDGIITGDLNGNITDVNEAVLRMYGDTNRDALIGKNVLDFLVERDRARALQESIESVRTGQCKTIEYTAISKNGAELPIEITTAIMRDEQGQPIGFVDIVRNMAERKKTEEALRESEERYSRLSAAAFEGIGVDEQGKIADANDQLGKMLGYERGELIGKSILDFVAPESRDLVRANMRKEFEGPYEHLAMRKDGSVFPVEIRVRPIRHRGQTAKVCAIRDITERKKLEKSLEENKEKFAGLFSGNPEATVFIDPAMNIVEINPRFESLFGYPEDEVKGKSLIDIIIPANLVEEGKALDVKAAEGYVYHDTVRMRKDGSLVPVSVSAAPIYVQDRLIGYIGVYKDISELKGTEAAMRDMMQKLAAVNEKLRVVGSLTRHDVRNKLSIVTGNVFLAKRKLPDNPVILDYLHSIDSACQQILRIFEFAHSYESLGVEELVYIDVGKTVDEAVALFPDLKDTKITNNSGGLTVLADSFLRQMFYNLIDNSVKHGQKISSIEIRYEEASRDELRLYYEDNGVGISETVKPSLFTEGFTTGKGTGYGLYLIKKMMEVYGWTIRETGTRGKGAQFTITIPRTNQNGKENYRTASHA